MIESFRERHILFGSSEGPNKELFRWTPMEAIRADGAVDVLADPTRYGDKEQTKQIIDQAQSVEVYTSRHRPEVATHYHSFAESSGKYWTSSDEHQNARYIETAHGTPLRTLEWICWQTMKLSSILAA